MMTKRLFDLVLALPLFILVSPFLLMVMLAIKATSPGPAVLAQIRVGRNRMPFRCLKLRTMYVGTPLLPTHEAPASSVTPLGGRLRKFKIDELPQLWNVCCGDMSLVGPRPCLPTQSALIEERQRRNVFSLLPGITGLAQIQGIDMSDPVRLAETDAIYLASRSIALDVRVLLRTISPG